MNESKLDLTQGNPYKLLVAFAIPMLIGGIFQLLYSTVDTIVVGKFVSADALAAIGATTSAMSLMLYFSMGFTNAASVIVAQAAGAKEDKRIRVSIIHGIYVAVILSVILGIISILGANGILKLLGTPDNIFTMAKQYFCITCGLIIGQVLYNGVAAILRSFGDSKTPLYFMIFSSLLNIVLDLLLVLVFNLGVIGVGVATVFSQFISAVLCLVYAIRKYPSLHIQKDEYALNMDMLKEYIKIGLPMGLQQAALSIGMLVITRVINGFGSNTMAAYTIGSKIENIACVAYSQVAFSFAVYAGQNFGAKKYRRIKEGLKAALIMVSGLAIVSTIIILIFSRPITLLFVKASETEVLTQALKMVRIEAVFYVALGAIWLYNSALRGMGFINITIASSLIELISKIVLSIVLSSLFGYIGIWFAAPIGWVLGWLPSFIYERNWEKKKFKKA